MSVVGIGGLFFRSKDPDARAAWYREHLGIGAGQTTVWEQAAGSTVFAPFSDDADYFPADQPFMLNLRVDDLSTLAERLEAAGITVGRVADDSDGEYGLFARIYDPEGLPIELWQPPAE